MKNLLSKKLLYLKKKIKGYKKVLLAYSGGVDSTLLLKVCLDTLGKENTLAVIASSSTYPRREIDLAIRVSQSLGIEPLIIKSKELNNPEFLKNTPERCYWCKKELFSELLKISQKKNIPYVLEGSNFDDLKDFRPGLKAIRELGIKSPLVEVRLTKKEIRKLSKKLGLINYNKPSFSCLSSRLPYGRRIDKKILAKIEKAEDFLIRLGLTQVRVRDFSFLAKIEIDKKDFFVLLKKRKKVIDYFKKLGYQFVTLDLEGYSSGSMNRLLNFSKI